MGAGNLGLALADYPGFRHDGFDIVALLDTAREKVGQYSRSGVPIRHARELERLAERERLDIAVVAVPAESAQEVVDAVVGAGRQGDPEFLARRAAGAERRQAEERGPDRVAREPVVLPGARRGCPGALLSGSGRAGALTHIDPTAQARMVDVVRQAGHRARGGGARARPDVRARRCGWCGPGR